MDTADLPLSDANGSRVSSSQINDRQIIIPHQFHIPAHLLAKIVSLIAADGIDALKSWILSGEEGIQAVYSEETLSTVRLDKSPDFASWSNPNSIYYPFISNCLKQYNPYALYIESLRLGFSAGDLHGALENLCQILDTMPVVTLAYLILCNCAGIVRDDVYIPFKRKFWRTKDIQDLGAELRHHISSIEPRRCNTYKTTWFCEDFPECVDYHYYSEHRNQERCQSCVYWYLSIDVCKLS